MSLIVPLVAVPKQALSVMLANQQVDLAVRQLRTGLFMDVTVGGRVVVTNVLCENLNLVVRSTYLGFVGDFAWWDTQGIDDPDYAEIGPGGRFELHYLTEADLAKFAASLPPQTKAA